MEAKDSKYIGMVLNAWWEIVSVDYDDGKHAHFTLKNKANGQVIENVGWKTIQNIISGKTQVSKLIAHRIYKEARPKSQFWW